MDLRTLATKYLSYGLSVAPASPMTKFTTLPRWKVYQKRRMTVRQAEANFADAEGICIICGVASDGLEMMDFDQAGAAYEEWKAAVEVKYPGLLASLPVERSQGGGLHVYYRCGEVRGNEILAVRDKKKLIETRGQGGLVICTPTAGYTMLQGDFANIPLLGERMREDLWEIARSFHRPTVLGTQSHSTHAINGSAAAPFNLSERIEKYLAECPPAISNSGGHSTCFTVVRAVVWGFDVRDELKALNYLERWNQTCVPPWSEKELLHKISEANTKPFSKPRGYLRDAESWLDPISDGVDLSHFRFGDGGLKVNGAEHQDEGELPGFVDPGPFPESLLRVPGFIEQVMEHNLRTAHRKQPVLALAGALCLQATLAGRKIRDYRNNRTNIYVVSVAASGSGKNHARKLNSAALLQGGAEILEGPEEVASDAGLINNLEQRPCMLMQIDEFSKFLRVLANPGKTPHLYSIISVFLKLYSLADGVFRGKAYADVDKNKTVDQPNLVLHATSVGGDFFDALTPESMQDGLVGRLMVFEGHKQVEREKPTHLPMPEEILAAIRWWRDYQPSGNLGSIHPNPLLVNTTPEAECVFDELGLLVDAVPESDTGWEKAVWARCEEKACRLALIYAASQDRLCPVIDEQAARWACAVAEYMTRRLVFLGSAHISENAFDAMQKKVLKKVTDNGGGITARQYAQVFSYWDRDTRGKVISNLLETEKLFKRNYATKTKPGVEYVNHNGKSTKPGNFVN